MDNFEYGTLTIGSSTDNCNGYPKNSIVDDTLQKEMMDAETEDQVLELSVERLYQSLKESIKL